MFYRSRPYQKNFTHVRRLFGYERFDNPELVELMNEIYQNYWNPLQNFFIPTMKLETKVRIGAKVKKKYDQPQTPYERVVKSTFISDEKKQKLKETKEKLDPFALKMGLEIKLKEFKEKLEKHKTFLKAA
jgi:hypothetical protein